MVKTIYYSVLKCSEGGIGQKLAIMLLREKGIEAKRGTSPYTGHTGITVTGGVRVQERAAKILYGVR